LKTNTFSIPRTLSIASWTNKGNGFAPDHQGLIKHSLHEKIRVRSFDLL